MIELIVASRFLIRVVRGHGPAGWWRNAGNRPDNTGTGIRMSAPATRDHVARRKLTDLIRGNHNMAERVGFEPTVRY